MRAAVRSRRELAYWRAKQVTVIGAGCAGSFGVRIVTTGATTAVRKIAVAETGLMRMRALGRAAVTKPDIGGIE
jgi:hypothetical protein